MASNIWQALNAGAKLSVATFRKKEGELKSGMDIFGMPQPPLKELLETEKDLEFLVQLWEIVREWLASYDSWKEGMFRDLKVDEMENAAILFGKRVIKLGREIKHWATWEGVKAGLATSLPPQPLHHFVFHTSFSFSYFIL